MQFGATMLTDSALEFAHEESVTGVCWKDSAALKVATSPSGVAIRWKAVEVMAIGVEIS